MKFSVLQQDLLPVLQSVSRSVGVRSTLPVLDNILLSLEGNKLKIAATNLEVGVIKFVSVEGVSSGELTIPAKTLVDLVSGLGQSKIELEATGEILSIQSGKLKAQINGILASEFPVIPLSEGKGVTFPKEVFLTSAQILYAAAVDEGRPVLTGILTDVKDGKLDFVATDGFRLAHRQVQLVPSNAKGGGAEGFKSLIPKRTFEEVLRVIGEENAGEVNISLSPNQNQAIFTIGQTIISSRLIEGQFPSWEKIIPTEIKTRALLDREELLKAIKLALVFAKNETNITTLTAQNNQISLESSAKELGSQQNQVDAQIEGDQMQIAFNSKFLLDAISNAPSSQLMMEFSGSLSPCLIKPVGVEGLEFIVMPVKI
ncbi:DNA polymerase III subunit beta [Candidatus Microgenomates bacterium]|nr:DNA polymerase III subunit beta [Candidatus Microgenomates bacterium]